MIRKFIVVAMVAGMGVLARVGWSAEPVASGDPAKPCWPQFRGPNRDGVSHETGLLQAWPEGGPKKLWSVSGVGMGYSSPIIVGDTLYITGDVDKKDLVIFAMDLSGKVRWRVANGKAWTGPWPGSRASCTWDGGRLFHMNAHGRTVCLDPANGRELWAVDVLERFGAKNPQWGQSQCLLVDGSQVLVAPGGPKCMAAALDRQTGQTVWTGEPLKFMRTHAFGGKEVDPPQPDTDKSGYASLTLLEADGRRVVGGCSGRHFYCADAASGKLLWTHEMNPRYEVNACMPARWGESLVFGMNGPLVRVDVAREAVSPHEPLQTPLDFYHGAVLVVGDRIYGASGRLKAWGCVDLKAGKVLQHAEDLTTGCATFADGRIYALCQDGRMALLAPTPEGVKVVSRFAFTDKPKKDVWAHPVICGGRLYLRYHDALVCYDVRR
ncbi:MAG: outer membrane biogenesis protein BamB [Planctomycetes bacterium ADurb.Bin126]|nr:MAG: outer membrane biogenesis protein BamB [Planctomycetes bacterium ADurb.Bin126]HOD82458.1 PQQ-binding-like beta-propeller repeat protein [Phycisphaerae bacterium]HQL73011.1 PQQ-binding-like beta-propeller repeat protein [Phycisphaerae bacterium]